MKKLIFILSFLLLTIVSFSQSIEGALKTLVASGTNTYTITEPLPAGYLLNERFIVRFTNANTGAATLNRNSLGAKVIVKNGGTPLASGDISAGQQYIVSYNGTSYNLVGSVGGSSGGGWALTGTSTLTGAATIAGSTSNTVQYTFPSLGQSHVTPGVGLWLKNPTTATNILNQNPPSITLEGSGWKTNATAGAQSAQFQIEGIINTGTTKPSIGIAMYDVINGSRGTAVANISRGGNNFQGDTFTANDQSGSIYNIFGTITDGLFLTSTKDWQSAGGPSAESALFLLDPAGTNASTLSANIVLQNNATGSLANTLIINGDYVGSTTDVAGLSISNGAGAGGKTVTMQAHDVTSTNDASITVDYGNGVDIKTTNGTPINISPATDSDASYVSILSGPSANASIYVSNSGAGSKGSVQIISGDTGNAHTASLIFDLQGGVTSTGVYFTDTRATPKGIEYFSDYSSTYSTRSLVDKGYVLGSKTYTGTQILRAGAAGAGNSPLKFTSGTNLTTPEAGAVEYNGTNLFFSPTTSARLSVAMNASAATSATTGTMTTTLTNLSVMTITPTGNCTFNASGGIAGQRCAFIITTSGTSTFTLTWGTNFKTTSTLATGAVTAKTFTVSFVYDGTNWCEVSRTTAM